MIKKIIVFIMLAFTCIGSIYAQEFRAGFNKAISSGNISEAKTILSQWEKENSDDPELYVAWFNYYVNESRKEYIGVDKEATNIDSLTLTKAGSDSEDPSGYINFEVRYADSVNKGFEYIDKGIKKYPQRLDMRFGKIYMYGQIKKFDKFTDEIVAVIEYSKKIGNKWTWTDNKPVEDAEEFMLETVQDYQVLLYRSFEDDHILLDHMQRIAETILKYYPKYVKNLTNLALVSSVRGNYNEALKYLLKAEKMDREDTIVLSNIAQVYKLQGKPEKAEKYYNLVIKYGDEKMQEYGKMQIEILKKQNGI